ncbi:CHAD domain-containing protein [Metallosphaera hakonensis]|uniref:CHAD domain-containing protein n=1 Tax=Metallosphaera hakonensis JCM 8857 = DSM 7519 TaxID=1293036 RepID=A0A2U9IWU4_9CREN|nr:CHAD domain-containing protein [Metallosphaera hakonensis]AWS00467.1 hypothetical protein DFR87_00880 [Metallosphaera hakonensis JCM 8857 = DSM 7519]
MRPEEYANKHLENFLLVQGRSPEQVHEARVELRKYAVIVQVTYPLHLNYDVIRISKGILRRLGEVRDYDVHGCPKVPREELLDQVDREKVTLKRLPKLYGSRFLVMRNLIKIFMELDKVNDFHGLRKQIRTARILGDSLNLPSENLKEISRIMGEERDRMNREVCNGLKPRHNVDLEDIREKARASLREILLSNHEFRHVKGMLSQY